MAHEETDRSDRRSFLQAGALATAGALGVTPGSDAQEGAAKATVLPKRKLGKTGLEITMLEMGTGALRERGVLDRLIRLSYASGVRTFDTAKAYGTEPGFKKWFEQSPEVRKQIVLVTKDEPRAPKEMLGMLDERLAALATDYVDLYFVHGLGDKRTLDESLNFITSQEFKETARRDPQVGQGQVHRLLDPSCRPRANHPGRGRRGRRRRDYAHVYTLARQG